MDSTALPKTVNTKQLLQLLREKQWQEPLCWTWHATEKPIFLQAMLRDLKSRRATFLADYQGQKSIVKLFYDKQGPRHARREIRGLQLLQQCHIATSQILYHTLLEGEVLLVLSYLDNTHALASLWDSWDEQKKKKCLSLLLQQLAKMYQQGVCHNDLHLSNILIGEEKIYIIDGMDVKRARTAGPLSYRAKMSNLADFFVQFSTADQALLWRVLAESAHFSFLSDANGCEGASPFKHDKYRGLLQKKIIQKSLYKQKKMQSKAWRECSAFTVGQWGAYEYVVAREQKESVATLFHHLKQQEVYFEPLKRGKANTVFRYQWNECDWVVKQYSARSWWHGLKHIFKGTHAAPSWQNANRLQLLHILTPKPIGILQKKCRASTHPDYFIMEYVPGQTLREYLLSFCDLQAQQQHMIAKVVQIMTALKQNRLCHRDVKSQNFQVCGDKLYLLDLDNLRVYPWKLFFSRAFNKDVKRFLKIWRIRPVLQQAFITAFKESNLL
jgi:tRNA A-37 threonylcarbamoyl transferase component Bud32